MSFDIPSILDLLGIELTSEFTSGWGKALCPLHEDSTPSFGINLDDGRWLCRAYCGNGNLTQLVSRVLQITLSDAFQWLARSKTHVKQVTSEDLILKLERPHEVTQALPFDFDGRRVPQFIVDRGFSLKELKRWGVSYDPEFGAAVLPADKWFIKRNPPGDPMKYYYPTEMPKSRLLFGQDRVEGTSVIVVEGPLDAIWMHQKGYRNTVAIMGMSLSQAQADIINRCYQRATLFLDNDPAGRIGTFNAIHRLKTETWVAVLPPGVKDPPEASDEQIYDAMVKRVQSLEWIMQTQRVRTIDLQRVQRDRKENSIGLEEILVATRKGI